MAQRRLRLGIVGLQPGSSWAARVHLPALRTLADDYEIIGIANSSLASGQAAAAACDIPRAFADVAELVASPDIDIVTVGVRVPQHLNIVKAALNAGKHVFCEWPLGNGLAEAEELTQLAHAKGVSGFVGTQARAAPEIEYLRQLIADGFVGEVLSTTLIGYGGQWGATITNKKEFGYLLDNSYGATLMTIALGHTLAALRDVLGNVAEVSAVLAVRQPLVRTLDTGEILTKTAHDQVLVSGLLESGVPISIHYRGSAPRGNGLFWEINGADGDIQITGASGHTQTSQLTLKGVRKDEKVFQELAVPESYRTGWPENVVIGNVARLYARMAADLRDGSHTAPRFDDAVVTHRVIAAIEEAASSGQRVRAVG